MKKKKYTDQELKYLKKEFPEEYEEYTEQAAKTRHRKKVLMEVLIIAIPSITLFVLLIAGALFGNPAIRAISITIVIFIDFTIFFGITSDY